MSIKMKIFFIIVITIFFSTISFTQQATSKEGFQIGNKIPNIELQNVLNYSAQKIRLSDFHEKALILDFWATWCAPCVAMFPKENALQKQFKNSLQFILISSEKPSKVEKFFNRLSPSQRSDLISAIDVSLPDSFNVRSVPHYVWIDSKGQIKAFTGPNEITAANIQKLVDGKLLNIPMKIDEKRRAGFDISQPLLMDRKMAEDIGVKYYSVLTPYIPGVGSSIRIPKPEHGEEGNRRITILNYSIAGLYRIAYTENSSLIYPFRRTVIEAADVNKYAPINSTIRDSLKNEYIFSYDLIIPKADSTLLFKNMQADLDKFFGLKIVKGKRPMKCFVLKLKDADKLSTNHQSPKMKSTQLYIRMQNQPFSFLADAIKVYIPRDIADVIDETGYNKNVDIDINVNIGEITELRKALSQYGIDVNIENRIVEVLVLSEKN